RRTANASSQSPGRSSQGGQYQRETSAPRATARVLAGCCWSGNSKDLERELQESQPAVQRALALDDRDPECHYARSILFLMARQHERALVAAQQAIDLNHNFAFGHFALGETRIFQGHFSQGLDPILRCLRLSPPWASSGESRRVTFWLARWITSSQSIQS